MTKVKNKFEEKAWTDVEKDPDKARSWRAGQGMGRTFNRLHEGGDTPALNEERKKMQGEWAKGKRVAAAKDDDHEYKRFKELSSKILDATKKTQKKDKK